jgi:hypothetical protein
MSSLWATEKQLKMYDAHYLVMLQYGAYATVIVYAPFFISNYKDTYPAGTD